jgi:glyoxylase-like metal-dependent hydrolase (beta-lactamase superfamily II)
MKKIKLYVLDNGKMWQDDSLLVAGSRLGNANNKNPPVNWADIPIHTFLIEHPDGYILFDTSCHPKGMTERWPEWQRLQSPYEVPEEGLLLNRLEQLKVRPSDIKYVVISHLHVDHGGCLEYFKNSEIIVSDSEFTKTMRQYVMNEDLGVHMPLDIKEWIKAELKWRPLETAEKQVELLEGVTILNLGPGHSWGMLGLLIELEKSGNVILASDAIYTKENVGPPMRLPGIMYDSLGYGNTIKYLTDLANKRSAQIWYGHDRVQFAGLLKSPEAHYD